MVDTIPGFNDFEVVYRESYGSTQQRISTFEKATELLHDAVQEVWTKNCSDDVLDRDATSIYTSQVAYTLHLIASALLFCAEEQEHGCRTLADFIRRAAAVVGLSLAADEERFCDRVHTLATKGRITTLPNDDDFTLNDHNIFLSLYDRFLHRQEDVLQKFQVRHLEVVETWS